MPHSPESNSGWALVRPNIMDASDRSMIGEPRLINKIDEVLGQQRDNLAEARKNIAEAQRSLAQARKYVLSAVIMSGIAFLLTIAILIVVLIHI